MILSMRRSILQSQLAKFPFAYLYLHHIIGLPCHPVSAMRSDFGTILKTCPAQLALWRQSGGKYHSLNLRIFEVHNIGIAEGG